MEACCALCIPIAVLLVAAAVLMESTEQDYYP